jgi:ankyrin repeat protein
MSKTALETALKALDLEKVQAILRAKPALKAQEYGRGFNLLQFCCRRPTAADRAAAGRQLKLAKWLVAAGFDPTVLYTTAPGEDGEEEPAHVSLAFFAVAAAQNNALARYFLGLGAEPNALFAAVWWANSDILEDLVRHGANINEVVGATPLHMAADLLHRGVERTPALARQRLKTLKEVLRLGGDPNIVAINGSTPLHSVIEKDLGVEAFTLLLKHGANPDRPGRDGRTVRDIAARKRDKKYADALQRVGL